MSDTGSDELRFRAGMAQWRSGITRAAVARLEELKHVDKVEVAFGTGTDLSILFKIPSLAKSNWSVFLVDKTGRLMLMVEKHDNPQVVASLEALHVRLAGVPPSDWLKSKPTFYIGTWERCTNAMLAAMKALATGADAVEAIRVAPEFEYSKPPVGPTIRPKVAQGAPQLLGAPEVAAAPALQSNEVYADLDVESAEDWATAGQDARVRTLVARWLRSRQSAFRRNLLRDYERRCCISDYGPSEVLEAAHIEDHATGSDNDTANGLLLRSDLHALFDEDLLRIDPNSLTVVLDQGLMSTPYAKYHGKVLRPSIGVGPSRDKLDARWRRKTPSPHT